MAKASTPRTIQCYHCRHRFDVPQQTMTTNCPKCSKPLSVEDVVIKNAHGVRKLQTCGHLTVTKKGHVMAQQVEAQAGIEVEGIMEANVTSGGPVKIGAKALWKGDLSAPSLAVELGGRIERAYFVIPDEQAAAQAQEG
jgi:cytoskeletal protein CcmA (bactofilin family)